MDAITTETVRAWHKELVKLRGEVANLTRKIEAAAVLGLTVPDQIASDTHGDENEVSLPNLIVAVLREHGTPVRPPEIKRLLTASGVPAVRLGKNGAYFYSSLMRLTKRGLIQKRGKRYSVSQ